MKIWWERTFLSSLDEADDVATVDTSKLSTACDSHATEQFVNITTFNLGQSCEIEVIVTTLQVRKLIENQFSMVTQPINGRNRY